MGLKFENVRYSTPSLDLSVDWSVPAGAFVGLIGPTGCGAEEVLRLAAGLLEADSGIVESAGARLAAASLDSVDPIAIESSIRAAIDSSPPVLLIGPCVVLVDRATRIKLMARLHRLQRAESSVVIYTHDLDLLERHADEVVAFDGGKIVERGDPRELLARYRRRALEDAAAASDADGGEPAGRHGDGRTRVDSVRLLDDAGAEVGLLRGGEFVVVDVTLRATADVAETVVGMMIRSRVGVTVYGTNTVLEGVSLGALARDDTVHVRFGFDCDLCPGEYTLTVASHDPRGTPHDWLEEAIFFTVEDSRYTAGVANLRAKVTIER